LILCGAPSALAQSTDATISGVVVDPVGKVIPDATIEIVNDSTGAHYSSATNGAGIYTVTILPPGQYRLQVSKVGFKTLIKPGIILNVQSAVALNFTLPLGATSESITVEAGASAINTTDGSVSTVIDRGFVENMPLNGRSFQDLLTLAPGVSQVPNSYAIGYGVGYSGDIVVNGQRTESNYYSVDGVSANTGAMPGSFGGGAGISGNVPSLSALGTTQSLVSVDDLQEFRSTTSSYSAEYGRSPGGQFSFSTRSGTSTLHGIAYDYFRNDALDSANWFNDFYGEPKGEERQNDFGGTLGGPVVFRRTRGGNTKTFFFFSYEGLRLDSPQAAMQVEVPDNYLRTSSPAALQPILDAFPIANGGSDGLGDDFSYYVEAVSYPSSLNSTSIRIDHSAGEKLSLFARYADSPSSSTAYTEAIRQTTQYHTRTATLGATYAVTPHQSNDLRFNFTQTAGTISQQSTDLGGATPFSLGSIPGPKNGSFPQLNSDLAVIFDYASYNSFQLSSLPTTQNQINITDAHNWSLGRHTFKAGVDWRRLSTTLASQNPVEEMAFDNESQVLENSPDYSAVEIDGSSHDEPLYTNFSSFLQDEWKATPRLSVALGLRWDINPAPTNLHGPDPYAVNQVAEISTTQLAPQGTPLWKTDWLGFAPRLGLAYRLHPESSLNTVIRAGFGVFYDPGNTQGSLGYSGIGFQSEQTYSSASFPLSSQQLALPAPSAATPYSAAVFGYDPNLKLPYSMQYNAAVEQAFSTRESLTVNYVGSGGRRLLSDFFVYPAVVGNTNFGASTTLQVVEGRASSGYNSLQVKYQRSISHGLQALTSYTWSHSIDNASSNFNIYELLRASSDFDIRHNLQAALSYLPPPINSSFRFAALLSGWGFDSRVEARTGVPVNIVGSEELNPDTGEYLYYQPNLVSGQPLYVYGHAYPGGRAINYHAFATAATGIQGDAPRNVGRDFGAVQFDQAIRRDVPLHDRLHLQIRAEAFNVFNHPMFGSVYNYLAYGPTLFGRAYNTLNSLGNLNPLYQVGGPRSLQLSLKILF
jgi:hypothetical protein